MAETPGFPWKQQQVQADPDGSSKLKKPKEEEEHSPPLPPPAWDDDDDWEITPLSGDHPFFNTFMSKSHVQKNFQLTMPAHMHRHLPEAHVPATLLCRGRSWAASYRGDLKWKKIGPEWRDFAVDNGLRVGDSCVFELIAPAAAGGTAATGIGSEGVVFRVQVLRGGLPEEITSRGATSDKPLVIADDD
ncbi:unnamed protein product [Urochloa decumbens]|uniref:TF-B3 domain-containing protein n=1 Tax=Urochloa decumbens TaxID=240449 RepID=A0ABC9DSZ2_9POAL